MVHIFSCLGHDFALDVESGTLLRLSGAAKRIMQKLTPAVNPSGDFLAQCDYDHMVYTPRPHAEVALRGGSSASLGVDAGHFFALTAEDGGDKSNNTDKSEDNSEYKEAQAEILQIIKEGALFSPEPKEEMPQYSGLIKSLCLNISHNCDLRCKYCFADGGSYSMSRKNMSFDVAKAAVDFLIAKSGSRKNLEIDFFGGEPLLNMDVVKKTVSYARSLEQHNSKKFRFTITTNGLGLTDALIDYFNKEMHNVVISIDGRENVHNSVRPDALGRGSFDRALAAAKRFRERRGDRFYYIRGTFTANNLDFAADVLALNDHGFDQISLEPVVLPDDHPLALKEEHLPFLKQQYELLAEEYLKRRGVGAGGRQQEGTSGADGAGKGSEKINDKWFNFFHFMLDLKGGPCLKKRITGCGAGCEYLAVNPDGDIFPCHRFDGKPEYKIGSVLNGDFEDGLPKVFAKSCIYTKEECKDCFCKYYCGGGCAANSIEYGGGINGQYYIGCQLMKKRIELALAIWAIESENGN